MKHRNRLLFVSYWAPYPVINGATLRMHNLLSNLQSSWDIDLLCPTPKNKEDIHKIMEYYKNPLFIDLPVHKSENGENHVKRIGEHIYNLFRVPDTVFALHTRYYERFQSAVSRGISERRYDAVLAFTSLTYGYYLSHIEHENITCDVCDSVTLLLRSMIGQSESLLDRISLMYSYIYNKRWEKKHLSKCKKLVVISDRDKNWLKKTVKNSIISVVENGVDPVYYHPDFVNPGTEKGLTVFTGVMNYPPNHDAMIYCIMNIFPKIKALIPEARLKIVGRNPKPELLRLASAYTSIEVTGEVPDIRDAVRGANLFLCPILGGAGMKNKILQAFAMGIPVITTREGSIGIDFEHGKVGYIAETPEQFALFTKELITDRNKWINFSRSARELIEKKYSWKDKSEKLSNILLQ